MYFNTYDNLIRDLYFDSFNLKMRFFRLYLTQVLAVRVVNNRLDFILFYFIFLFFYLFYF